mmetsp:Transcript_1847/g.6915  ORF Transcript_1847/g.6915 Transcript_1847/m.6915 type:complete len:390 (-) Transcript_1847:782-1951(-)
MWPLLITAAWVTVMVGIASYVYVYVARRDPEEVVDVDKEREKELRRVQFSSNKKDDSTAKTKQVVKKSVRTASKRSKSSAAHFSHPLLIRTIGGHHEFINDFGVSHEMEKVTTMSVDRTIRIWDSALRTDSKYSMKKVESDHGKDVRYPDQALRGSINGKATSAVFFLELATAVKGYTIQGLTMQESFQVPFKSKGNLMFLEVLGNGVGFVTFSDTMEMNVWNMHGDILSTLNTHQGKINDVRLSKDGRFIATAGFTSEVQIYEVELMKGTTSFSACRKVMDLQGHKAAVYSVDFSTDGKMAATVSRDGFLMLWNINVRYREQESCKLVLSIKPEGPARLDRIRLSPDGKIAAISEGSSVWFYSTADGHLVEKIENSTPTKSPSSGGYG